MPSYDFAKNKKFNKVYFGKAFPDNTFGIIDNDSQPRYLRIVSGVVAGETYDISVPIKGDIVLRRTPKEREEIRVTIFEDERKLINLVLQRYMVESGKPKDHSFTLTPAEAEKLLKIIVFALDGNFRELDKMQRYDSEVNARGLLDLKAITGILSKNPELIKTLVEENVLDSDIVAIAYRKKQLDVFKTLLSGNTSEGEWQNFFEDNPWIFGYGLNYVFLTNLDGEKLSQAIKGHTLGQHGKTPDAIMKTRAAVSMFCLVEIKKSETRLLSESPYRSDVWQPSKELSGGIAQAQRYQEEFIKLYWGEYRAKDDRGSPTGEAIYNFSPKTYLVIGNLSEFTTTNGVNIPQLGSFELLRKNLHSPEIITFDELYERASFIVSNSEQSADSAMPDFEEDDIPF